MVHYEAKVLPHEGLKRAMGELVVVGVLKKQALLCRPIVILM
jgi:hypothetical protein